MYTLVVCALEKKATNEVIVLAAVITSFAVGWTVAQSCESKAVSRKASRFMVLPSFVRKCKQNAHESQAASKEAPHAAKAIHGPARALGRPPAHSTASAIRLAWK